MTTEQKFKKLLYISYDNGYVHDKMTIDIDKDLNNLILNTNFFECLFGKAHLKVNKSIPFIEVELYKNYSTSFETLCFENLSTLRKFQWVLEVEKGTALEWLFKQFDL